MACPDCICNNDSCEGDPSLFTEVEKTTGGVWKEVMTQLEIFFKCLTEAITEAPDLEGLFKLNVHFEAMFQTINHHDGIKATTKTYIEKICELAETRDEIQTGQRIIELYGIKGGLRPDDLKPYRAILAGKSAALSKNQEIY